MHSRSIFGSIAWNTWILCQSDVCDKHGINIFDFFNFYIVSSISSQGIAYRNIENTLPLYAMICSTSAKSSVRLINTSSIRDCLQFRCMKIITKYPQLLNKVRNIPGLTSLCRDVWYLLQIWILKKNWSKNYL